MQPKVRLIPASKPVSGSKIKSEKSPVASANPPVWMNGGGGIKLVEVPLHGKSIGLATIGNSLEAFLFVEDQFDTRGKLGRKEIRWVASGIAVDLKRY